MPNATHGIPLTSLIHENLSIVMMFAFSRQPLTGWLNRNFRGEWKYLGKACYEIPETRVNRAVLELATLLRLLDDKEILSEYFKKTDTVYRFGKVVKADGTEEELYFRDLTNKILHSSGIEWQLVDQERPVLVCHSNDPSRWVRAEISISAVAALCGGLMS